MEQYRLLFERNPSPMWVCDEGTLQFMDVNAAALALYGYSRAEFLRRRAVDICSPHALRNLIASFRRPRRTRPTSVGEWKHQRQDGTVFDAAVTVSCLEYGGRPARLVLVNDVIERNRAQRALQASEEHCRAVMEVMRAGILTVNGDGRVESANASASWMFDRPLSALAQQPFLALFAAGDQDAAAACVREGASRRAAGHRVAGRLLSALRRDGTEFPVELSVAKFASGGRPLLAATLQDLSERRRLEGEVTGAFERAQRELGMDLHDGLGQHLGGMKFLASSLEQELSKRGAPEAGSMHRFLGFLDEGIEHVRSIARGLRPLEAVPDGLMRGLHELSQEPRAVHGRSIQFRCAKPVLVADPMIAAHLYRIAQEAVNNALKHSGCRRVLITLSASRRGIRLMVRDDGSGMGPRHRGMGLHVMQYRVSALCGTLAIRSAPGAGTTILCCVPSAGGAAPPPSSSPSRVSAS